MILGDSLHKRLMTFPQSWTELTPHQISLTTPPGVASKSTRILAHPSLTSSLYRLEGIKKLVLNAPHKTCDNDPILTRIVKDCINEL